jgi:hypothetical protein
MIIKINKLQECKNQKAQRSWAWDGCPLECVHYPKVPAIVFRRAAMFLRRGWHLGDAILVLKPSPWCLRQGCCLESGTVVVVLKPLPLLSGQWRCVQGGSAALSSAPSSGSPCHGIQGGGAILRASLLLSWALGHCVWGGGANLRAPSLSWAHVAMFKARAMSWECRCHLEAQAMAFKIIEDNS